MRALLYSFCIILLNVGFANAQDGSVDPDDRGPIVEEKSYFDDGTLAEVQVGYYIKGEDQMTNHGTMRTYYPDGTLKMEKPFKDGAVDGVVRVWFANGQLSTEMYFTNDIWNGPYRMWYENGNKHTEGAWINGERKGNWVAYDENGNVVTEDFFD